MSADNILHKTDKCGIIKNNYTFFTFIFYVNYSITLKFYFVKRFFEFIVSFVIFHKFLGVILCFMID